MAENESSDETQDRPAYSYRFISAMNFAAHEHRRQVRKGTRIPYMSHLMAVSGFIMEAEGTEDQWIAGLLHDAIEDADATYADIARDFGTCVADIVQACSDYIPERDGGEKPPWRERKEAYIDALWHDPVDVLLVSTADKWHNSQAILNDLAGPTGSAVWSRFTAPPCCVKWYYESILAVMEQRLHNPYAVGRLTASVTQLAAKADAAMRDGYPAPEADRSQSCAFGSSAHLVRR